MLQDFENSVLRSTSQDQDSSLKDYQGWILDLNLTTRLPSQCRFTVAL